MDLQPVHPTDFPPHLRLVKSGEIETARADLDRAYAEHLQQRAVDADELRDARYVRWQRRVTPLCIGVFYLFVFIASFQAGRLF